MAELKECGTQKEILRTRSLLKHNRFKQSRLTLCPPLPRAQLLCCSAGLTTRSTWKWGDLVPRIISVRNFSLSLAQKDGRTGSYHVVTVLISVLSFSKRGVMRRSGAVFSGSGRLRWSSNRPLLYTSVADARRIRNRQRSLKAFVF